MTTLGEMTADELLDHDDRVLYLQELGVRRSFHAKGHLCIHKSSTSPGYNISTPTAKNIVDKALTSYKHSLGLERERQATERRLERERAREAADREATVRFKANR